MAEHPGTKSSDGVAGSLFELYPYKGKTYSVHPVAHLFPLMEGTAFEKLVESLLANSLDRPIVVTGPDAVRSFRPDERSRRDPGAVGSRATARQRLAGGDLRQQRRRFRQGSLEPCHRASREKRGRNT